MSIVGSGVFGMMKVKQTESQQHGMIKSIKGFKSTLPLHVAYIHAASS